ncbi:MAG: hypothetical protein V7655_03080 [Aequorivita antarctica]
MNSIREKIWYFLIDSKTNELVASLITKKYQKWDLYLNIFLAVMSSSSVAAWAIWRQNPTLWLLLIALTQLFSLAKPYFLFPKYVKIFNEKSLRWQQLTVDLEEIWFKINNGLITEENAITVYFDYKKRALSFDNFPEDIIYFDYQSIQKVAEQNVDVFINKI